MNYWETETPVKATTRRNEIEYYKEAGKLAISRPAWTDDSGNTRRGKTVTLALQHSGKRRRRLPSLRRSQPPSVTARKPQEAPKGRRR